ncbi:MAG: ATP-dependent zinc metalloprotease FtsH [Parcubacteria group bacterium GW2011_GWA2_36_10]|nr:MAG: ATP-dependent zinc metalloprotease FtsH [Parcubacteria group bacterium GW2011_GWA2_36_10]
MKNIIKNFAIFFLVFAVIGGIFSLYNNSFKSVETISISQLVQEINQDKVEKINVTGDKLNIILKDKSEKQSTKEAGESLSNLLKNYGVEANKLNALNIEVGKDPNSGIMFSSILPFLIPALFILGLIWFMMRQVSGVNNRAMSFGQSGAKMADQEKIKVTFKDVAGAIEAKNDLEEIVEFLKSPQKFIALGAKIPKGVLLLGSPGTGKTLLSRAVAGEAKVPFFHISGSEFVEMFVGVGASRVRDLFKKAKKASPCIVFIDEIDAVGRQRGSGLGGSHDEREQTLNQILTEMDGFDNQTNVIVLAATNRPDVLDPALLRPGRFDRQVVIDMPDIKDREAILNIHAKGKPMTPEVDLKTVAQRTPGFSGADLANVLNEAAILTAHQNQKVISQQNILDSIERVLLGPERKSHILSDKEKEITAYHEAGHAIVAHYLEHADPVHKISIISRGRAAGYTINLPNEDKKMHGYADFIDEMAVLLGGRVAEQIFFAEVTTGASNDLERATAMARSLITQFGMNKKLGLRTFGKKEEMVFLGKEIHERRDYSEKTAEVIDQEISNYVEEAAKTAERVIKENENKIKDIVKVLIAKETIEKADFDSIMA